jgi:hypothetical protein
MKAPIKKVKKPATPQQLAERRAKRWRKTGVSESTVQWMRANGCL